MSATEGDLVVIQQEMPLSRALNQPDPAPPNQCPATPAKSVVTVTDAPSAVRHGVKRSTSRWMERSSLKVHFNVLYVDNKKRAECVYCGKMFNEGESTGNLSKHVTAVHPNATRSKTNKVCKVQTQEMIPKELKSLQLCEPLMKELEENRGTLHTLLFLTEGFLPYDFVKRSSWGIINEEYPENTLIQSKTTLKNKIELYKKYLDESLHKNLQQTTLVNVQLNIWTSGNRSFLAVMVSFAPNILNEESLDLANDSKILLNNRGESRNSHLLDFVTLSDKQNTGKDLCGAFMSVLQRHKLVEKLGTVTLNNATKDIDINETQLWEHVNDLKPTGSQVGKVSYIPSGNHLLNSILKEIMKSLREHHIFADALDKLKELATIIRQSSEIRESLKTKGIPLIPYDRAPTGWFYSWKQINVLLQNHSAYVRCLEAVGAEFSSSQCLMDQKTIQMLTYFVECCGLLSNLHSKCRDDKFSNLPACVPLLSPLDHYYKLCSSALAGNHISETKGMSFSYFNGPDSLTIDEKRVVLQAIKDSLPHYQDYLSHIQANPLFYVAVVLDPTAKQRKLHDTMEKSEYDVRMGEVDSFIRDFLQTQKFARATGGKELNETPHTPTEGDPLSFRIYEAQNPPNSASSDTEKADYNETSPQEWERYQQEPVSAGVSRQEAINWWYDHRHTYPLLFKLAMSLFYTTFTTCDIERCCSIVGTAARSDWAGFSQDQIRTTMILRDRFLNFNFYGGFPFDGFLNDKNTTVMAFNDTGCLEKSSDVSESEQGDYEDSESGDCLSCDIPVTPKTPESCPLRTTERPRQASE